MDIKLIYMYCKIIYMSTILNISHKLERVLHPLDWDG